MFEFTGWLWQGVVIVSVISVMSYMVPFLLAAYVWKKQDLKVKYNAEWAMVTGGSSGIGRALSEQLAAQGLNIVIVSLDDDLLVSIHENLTTAYPKQKFRKVPVNMGKKGYMEVIEKACVDITIQLIFNNAGYVMTGLYADTTLGAQLANYECNATAPMQITHVFLNKLLDKKLPGCVCFTSSPAGMIPCPMTTMYGATKAFLTEFAVSVAAEVKADGVDVLVVHPSPVDTGFYSGNKHDIGAMEMFRKTATSPEAIADCFFRSLGRSVVHDQGYFSLVLRLLLKSFDLNLLSNIIALCTSTQGDYKKSKKKRD